MVSVRPRALRCLSPAAWGLVAAMLATVGCGSGSSQAPASKRWSVFEDHSALVRSGPARREQTLRELKALGADTLRIEVKWNEVAPAPRAGERPAFDAADPAAYHGFAPYDDLVRRAFAKGFRILMDLAPDAPRWATEGRPPVSFESVNLSPDAREFGDFAAAVGSRYSGHFERLPAVRYFSIWNEPNHVQFLKPNASSPAIYRALVGAAVPRLRANAAQGTKIFVGETAPVGRSGKVMGPRQFLLRWLCLDDRFRPTRRDVGCLDFQKVDADGFAHHPYGPVDRVARKADIINLLAIRRLGELLDGAARAGRLPPALPIYSTEFGLQSNPPDPTVTTTLARQAELLNEKEEFSFHYPRLRSYAQYLLYDDPARPGPEDVRWSGFQTGLRFSNGPKKPAYDAYRLPIVVHERKHGVVIWGHVRPGSGLRFVQLEREQGGHFVGDGGRFATDEGGYFEVTRRALAVYRFEAYDGPAAAGRSLGFSRTAEPVR
jgi:hypothetical protein